MELQTLEYFLTVAQEENITAAAKRLHVSQPTLSRLIKNLETEVGARLFERRSHSVALTPAGTILRQRAEQLLDLAETTRRELASTDAEPVGDVHIATAETCCVRELTEAMRRFRHAHPRSRIHFVSGNVEDAAARLDEGSLDFAVMAPWGNTQKYEFAPLSGREKWMLLVRADNPLAQQSAVRKEDLLSEPLIVSRQGTNRRIENNALAAWFGEDMGSIDVVATYNVPFTAHLLVLEGHGSAITWSGTTSLLDLRELRAIPLEPRIEDELAIVWKKTDRRSRAAAAFLDCLRDSLPSAGGRG